MSWATQTFIPKLKSWRYKIVHRRQEESILQTGIYLIDSFNICLMNAYCS